jgi:DNA-binding protein HU-beta
MTWASPPEAVPISQSDLVARVASRTGASIEATSLVVEALFAAIHEVLAEGSEVRLVGFGSFGYRWTPQHTAIDLQTWATVVVPEQTQILFDCGSDLRVALNQPAEG